MKNYDYIEVNPKISVVMGVFNGEERLELAINSIIEQTYTNWEFIICDDCSTDNSYEKLLEISKKDNRIKIIRNEKNIGLAASLNKCIDISSGDYIARMDDDDYSYPYRFEKQIEFLEKHSEFGFVSSAIDLFDGEKIISYQNIRKKIPEKSDFLWGSCFVHPATIFRKDSIMKVNCYRVSKETRRTEDYDLFMRMYSKGIIGYNFSERLLRYYINTDSMKKRKYIYRLDEAIVRYNGFKALGLLPKGIPYIFKPLLVGLIPRFILIHIQNHFYKN